MGRPWGQRSGSASPQGAVTHATQDREPPTRSMQTGLPCRLGQSRAGSTPAGGGAFSLRALPSGQLPITAHARRSQAGEQLRGAPWARRPPGLCLLGTDKARGRTAGVWAEVVAQEADGTVESSRVKSKYPRLGACPPASRLLCVPRAQTRPLWAESFHSVVQNTHPLPRASCTLGAGPLPWEGRGS